MCIKSIVYFQTSYQKRLKKLIKCEWFNEKNANQLYFIEIKILNAISVRSKIQGYNV